MNKTLLFDKKSIGILNLNEICRFCLSNEGILLSIFGFKEGEKQFKLGLPEKIKSVLTIEVSLYKYVIDCQYKHSMVSMVSGSTDFSMCFS